MKNTNVTYTLKYKCYTILGTFKRATVKKKQRKRNSDANIIEKHLSLNL